MRCTTLLPFAILSAATMAAAQTFPDELLAKVKARLAEGATHSWELGTRIQTLIELDTPSYSVLNPKASLPPPTTAPGSLKDVLKIVQKIIKARSQANNGQRGPQPFIPDGSAADPASNGVGVLLADWTGAWRSDGLDYKQAVQDQIDYLYQKVPRASNGALSHREKYVQLWSDFVYMVPPFLSYFGIIKSDQWWVAEGYRQIKYYRELLLDKSAGNLWKHILLGPNSGAPRNDEGHWSTGNAWAAAGMLRVLGTIKNSKYANNLKDEQADLAQWVAEIHGAMYAHLPASGIFTNYASDSSSFPDAASTALLASTVYRYATLVGPSAHLADAERSRKALAARAANGTYAHFDQAGWLTPVVNPLSYGSRGSKSPEAQAFVLLLATAYDEYQKK